MREPSARIDADRGPEDLNAADLARVAPDLTLRQLPPDYFAERIRARRYFSYAKINHGWWEALLTAGVPTQGMTREARVAADHRVGRRYLYEGGFVDEMIALLKELPGYDDDLFFGVSPFAWPGSHRIEGTPVDLPGVAALIQQLVPRGVTLDDGLYWKENVILGAIADFFDAIRPLPVVVVGPEHLDALGAFARLDDVRRIPVHIREARGAREETLDRILAMHQALGRRPVVYLLQAGELAAWLAMRLHGRLDEAFVIDLGRTLDIAVPAISNQQNWVRAHRAAVTRGVKQVCPLLPAPDASAADRVDTVIRRAMDRPRAARLRPVAFVEDKPPDLHATRDLLELSRAENRWTNFGPTSALLEEALHAYLALPQDRTVVACASGTSALMALVATHEQVRGRRLRWVISAFSFAALACGPLSGAQVVDCDAEGMLDLDQLRGLDLASYDGVVVTNAFGLAGRRPAYEDWCRENGKSLIWDNAAALDGFDRTGPDPVDEIVSFHHTKPWGVGEGGCAILPRRHEATIRALLNHGAPFGEAGASPHPAAQNGRLPEVSSALILARLRDAASWQFRYRRQARRIVDIGRRLGLEPVMPIADAEGPTPGFVPFRLPREVNADRLANPHLVLKQYYAPLAPLPAATTLYRGSVCVPCHPDVARLSPAEVTECLAGVLGKRRSAVAG